MTSSGSAAGAAPSPARGVGTLLLAVGLLLAVHYLPTPPPLERAGDVIALTNEGKACLAILAFAITLWVTEAVPFPVTSLAVLLLIPTLGIAGYERAVAAGFGNPLIKIGRASCRE